MFKPLLVLFLVVWTTSCSPNVIATTKVTTSSLSPTQTVSSTVTPIPFQPEEVKTEEQTSTIKVTETEEPNLISLEGLYPISIKSEFITDWYRSMFKQLEIKWCEQCSLEQIEAQLEYAGKNWVVVQHEHVLYTHSGWSLSAGPELGEILLRMYKTENLRDSVICLQEEACYEIVDYKILERDSIGGIISLGELFNVQEDDYFIFTCATQVIPGVPTPKLILQIRQLK